MRAARELVRKAGHEHRRNELIDGGNEDWPAVQGGAAAFASDKQLIPHRVVNDPDDGDSRIFERYRDGEGRQPMSEVGRTVERINYPAVCCAQSCAHAALFAEEIVLRTDGPQTVGDEILRGSVGFGYQVDSSLEPDLMRLAEAVTQDFPRVASDLHRLTRIFV
jgi:hypothetical protein